MTRVYVADVTLFDGREVREHHGVLVDDDRITWVGPHGSAPSEASSADEVVDGGGHTLSPGLVDAHVHLAYEGTGSMDEESRGLTDESARANAVRNLERHLDAGVTTVRDLGAPSAAICGLAAERVDGLPGVVAAGRALTIPGGHGLGMFATEVAGAEALRAAVREQVASGAGVIKVIATGGVVTPGIGVDFTAYEQEELDAVVEEAHGAGVGVAAHAPRVEEAALERMLERGTFHVATITPGQVLAERADAVPDYALAKAREIAPAREASFRRTVAAGVRHAAGTDAGTPLNVHGTLPRELASMVAWGMSPLDAMRSATSGGAELLGLPDVGVVEPGRLADLVLYRGNPCEDIAAAADPVAVWRRGERVR